MFSISDKDIAAIRAAFERGGEMAATIELRRIFPGIPDNAEARRIAFIIAGWRAVPEVGGHSRGGFRGTVGQLPTRREEGHRVRHSAHLAPASPAGSAGQSRADGCPFA